MRVVHSSKEILGVPTHCPSCDMRIGFLALTNDQHVIRDVVCLNNLCRKRWKIRIRKVGSTGVRSVDYMEG